METTLAAQRLLHPIPANHTLGLSVTHAVDGTAEVEVQAAPNLANVVGSMHSSGLMALADAAGLAAFISMARSDEELDGVIPLGASAEMQFLAPARGVLVARCTLGHQDGAWARGLFAGHVDHIHISTATDVRSKGQLVATGRLHWSIKRERTWA
jgi:acyl-coenzyme A thioesterase PaaI-like protein